ncbi:MAG TPA: CocE/NonD family hydrolase [candidate division Zixibacteria bacterium]|nr:CocE/NonD family hydrolase [candidate division Zixibacteria bacterium]
MKLAKSILITLFLVAISATSTLAYIEDSTMVMMRDSVHLATQIYLPDFRPPPYPVVLQRTPYNRRENDLTIVICDLFGYAFVSQNVRGMRDSEGDPMVFLTDGWGELKDGYDCIDWVIEQPWCNGKVGMMGASAPGMTQYMAAGAMHPNLTMICPILAGPSMFHHVAYQGGVFRKVLVENWLYGISTPWLIDTVANHYYYDTLWAQVDLTTLYDSVSVPTFHIAAWFDMYTDGQIEAFQRMNAVHGNNKLLIAPCGHGDAVGTLEQGDLVFPPNALVGEAELISIARNWYDYWLFDSPTGIMDEPAVQYYLTGDCNTEDTTLFNRWMFSDVWPSEGTEYVEYYLHKSGNLDTLPPATANADSFIYDPANPSPTIGGREFIGMDAIGYGPKDQAPLVESRSDVLIYSTPVLEEPMAVTGKIKLILYAESNRIDTDFAVRVTDVYPDGRSILMTDGILRARFRKGLDAEIFLTPGVPDTFEIDAWSIGHVFNTGHLIRIVISSSNYPRFSKNPNTGAPFVRDDPVTLVAENVVHMSSEMPSHLLLPISPVIPAQIAEFEALPENIAVHAYPNPFNSACRFTIENGQHAVERVEIYDVSGRIVERLDANGVAENLRLSGNSSAGGNQHREFVWNPDENLPSGVYLVRAKMADRTASARVMYLK